MTNEKDGVLAEEGSEEGKKIPKRRSRAVGRPKMSAEKKRAKSVTVRLSDAEHAALSDAAGPIGISDFIRSAALNQNPAEFLEVPELYREIWTKLGQTKEDLETIYDALEECERKEILRETIKHTQGEIAVIRNFILGMK